MFLTIDVGTEWKTIHEIIQESLPSCIKSKQIGQQYFSTMWPKYG